MVFWTYDFNSWFIAITGEQNNAPVDLPSVTIIAGRWILANASMVS